MWLAVASTDVPASFTALSDDWKSALDPAQQAAAEAASNIVIDPDAPETTCPACLTTFTTGPQECPDCGLCIG